MEKKSRQEQFEEMYVEIKRLMDEHEEARKDIHRIRASIIEQQLKMNKLLEDES